MLIKHFFLGVIGLNMFIFVMKLHIMQTLDLLKEINRLPLNKKFYIIEETLKSIKKEELDDRMESAVKEMYSEYATNKELTAFTEIDFDNFYESK
jgi:hypothetical protein